MCVYVYREIRYRKLSCTTSVHERTCGVLQKIHDDDGIDRKNVATPIRMHVVHWTNPRVWRNEMVLLSCRRQTGSQTEDSTRTRLGCEAPTTTRPFGAT